MNEFATLIHHLSGTTSQSEKIQLLSDYFSTEDEKSKLWALALLCGNKPKRTIRTTQLKQWCIEFTEIKEWLFAESYQLAGDLAETIALLVNNKKETPITKKENKQQNLAGYLEELSALNTSADEEKKTYIFQQWHLLNINECFVFNKLITGGFRIGVSESTVCHALAKTFGKPVSEIQHRLSGNWTPDSVSWNDLLLKPVTEISKPYPFYLCYQVENNSEFHPDEWQAEWKWDGIRGQIIKRENELFIWSRGEELITDHFPDLHTLNNTLINGTVLDGEIICMHAVGENIRPLPFSVLQKRISRKKPGKQILKDAPAYFVAYDLLEWEGQDIRHKALQERRYLLEKLFIKNENLIISPLIKFQDSAELETIRANAQKHQCEGVMLKRKDSPYLSGRKKGDWWKWKKDPLTIDCVLIYAQVGHGRRSGLYTDYTFAVKDGDRLVSFTKAYSGLTDKEIKEVDAFVKKNGIEKFGPVRTVKPELVFEISFEGIQESKRHKSGVALRFPRINRWRKDKKPDEINTLDDLKVLLRQVL
jgi:DNA ligase-1